MTLSLKLTALFLALLCQAFPAEGAADPQRVRGAGAESIVGGSLEAFGPDGAILGGCPLEHTEVRAEISGFVARVSVTQVFRSPFPDPIEAVYTFPLSERGAVDHMRIRTEGREIRGEIHPREEARRLYEEARERGQLAALLDQERPNVFTQSLANLMPGATVEIEIRYVETLPYEDGGFEWSFPMVVGPRFVPGAPTGHSGTGRLPDTTRVPDASRITPPVAAEGTRAGHDISLQVELDAGVAIEGLDSRLHEIQVERPSETRARIRLREASEIPNRDFVLRYRVAGEHVKSGVLTHREDGDGYLTLILIPPERVTPESAAPKELVFVIDRSGSQRGLPLLKAKETLLWTLEHLNPRDTFQVVSFSNETEKLFDRPQLATPEALGRARAYVNRLAANGGTMMAEAVQEVCSSPAPGNRLRVVTFMTDGYVGNDFAVIDLVKRLRGSSRWFPFGTGNSVNRFLLEQIARHGGGEVEYVLLSEPGEDIARHFWERIAAPVLTDLRLEFRELDVVDVLPYEVQDLWAQRPLIVHARYGQPGRGEVVLRGYQNGRPYEQRLRVELPRVDGHNDGIASMWARARVDDLMARDLRGLQSGQFADALEREIIEVALSHRILTQFTSFVAVEDRVVNEGGTARTVTVPVELPAGVDRTGALGSRELAAAEIAMSAGRARRRLVQANAPAPALKLEMQAVSGADASAGAPLASALYSVGFERLAAPSLAEPESLDAKLIEKLGPHLRAFFERTSQFPIVYTSDGWLSVRVELSRSSAEVLAELERAGLRVTLLSDRAITGSIALAELRGLLELDFVERVTLP